MSNWQKKRPCIVYGGTRLLKLVDGFQSLGQHLKLKREACWPFHQTTVQSMFQKCMFSLEHGCSSAE